MPDTRLLAIVVCAASTSIACTSKEPSASEPGELSTANAVTDGAESSFDEESSVRPGVNAPYFEEDALARYSAIFEAERREVFENRDAIVAEIGVEPGMVVADIGAGTGLFTNAIAERVGSTGRVYAVDIVPGFLARIDERAREADLAQVTTVLGGERKTTLPPRSVDLVFICNTYHHLEYPNSYLRSVLETLRPDGVLVLIDFERIEGQTPAWRLNHVRAGKETVVREVTEAGFVLDEEVDLLTDNYYLRFTKR